MLIYLESKGIMHRDLKPENLVLLSKENSDFIDFRVVDFGLAAYVNENERIFNKCGTPGFIAPEVFYSENGNYDQNCDIFSVGCILYLL